MLIAQFLHFIGFTIWIGGMFFALHVLRPASANLETENRLTLWHGVLRRFFRYVWVAIVLVFASGVYMISQLGSLPGYVTTMFMLGVLMALIFALVFFAPYRTLGAAVDTRQWQLGSAAVGQIRKLVSVNLVLGIVTIGVATVGRML